MKRNRKKSRGGKSYWAKMESARLFQSNVGFMDKTATMPPAFRIKFAWEIFRGRNPITGNKPDER